MNSSKLPNLDAFGLWPLRLAWLVMPATVGYGLAGTFGHLDEGPQLAIELWWWLAWFAGFVATLVPHPVSVTVIRVLAPASVVACVVAAGLHPGFGDASIALWFAIGWSLLVAILAYGPIVGDRMVNGSAYGSERRMALRAPGFGLAVIGLVGLACVLAVITPPLLLAGEWYLLALAAAVIGAGVSWYGGRMLHQLARRWIVFVPAGFVIHDPMSLVEPVLLRRSSIAALGPAADPGSRSGGEVTDLSGSAIGLALEVETKEPTPFTLRRASGSGISAEAEAITTSNVIFTPSLPGALLAEARIRGIKIGQAEIPTS